MSLFADFSFTSPPSRGSSVYQDVDMDSISPSSSRSASPSASDIYSPAFPPPRRVSVAELTSSLDRTNLLAPPRSTPSPLALRLQTQSPSSSRRSSSHQNGLLSPTSGGLDGHFESVRRRRAEGARLHCSGARLASIETLVDRMLRDGSSCYASLHPSARRGGSGGSGRRGGGCGPTSAPTTVPVSPTMGLGMSDSGDEEEEDSDVEVGADEPRVSVVVGRGGVVSLKGAGRRSGVEKRRGGMKRR